jgi:hypothetical protein
MLVDICFTSIKLLLMDKFRSSVEALHRLEFWWTTCYQSLSRPTGTDRVENQGATAPQDGPWIVWRSPLGLSPWETHPSQSKSNNNPWNFMGEKSKQMLRACGYRSFSLQWNFKILEMTFKYYEILTEVCCKLVLTGPCLQPDHYPQTWEFGTWKLLNNPPEIDQMSSMFIHPKRSPPCWWTTYKDEANHFLQVTKIGVCIWWCLSNYQPQLLPIIHPNACLIVVDFW